MTDNTALTTTGSSSTVPQDDLHAEDALASLILVGILIIAALIAYLITHKRWTIYFPESGAAMILGIVIGGILRLLTLANFNHQLDFEPEKFYFILLPPIIFEAGYNMNKKNFFLNMTSILLFSVLGTLLSAFVVGFGLFGVTKAGMIKSLSSDHPMECLLFGALISATDPVATLSIMGSKELRVQPLLYSLIFGESVLNDAVAIVLFRTLSGFSTSSKGFQGIDLLKSMGTFVLVSLGSLGIGVGVGLISAFLFKRTKSMKEHPYMEVSLLALFAYSSYLASEWAGMSGVMSLFLCGVVMKHYNWYSLSSEAQTSTSHLFKTMSFVAETFVFVYLGTSLLHATDMKWDPALIAVSLLLILLGRAVNIFPISFLLNLRRKVKITIKMQVMLWFVGLRGAIAFALAMNLHTPHSSVLVTTTLFIALFTTLVLGCSTAPIVRKLGLLDNEAEDHRHKEGKELLLTSINSDEGGEEEGKEKENGEMKRDEQFLNVDDGILLESTTKKTSFIHKKWRIIDEKLMKPLFGGKPRQGYSVT